jgi:hypothetical protein
MPLDDTRWPQKSRALADMDHVIALLNEEHRWCQKHLRIGNARCILGAMHDAGPGATERLKPVVLQAIRQVTGRDDQRIEDFNDHPLTTHARVVTVLRQARVNILCPPAAPPPRRFARLHRLLEWATS